MFMGELWICFTVLPVSLHVNLQKKAIYQPYLSLNYLVSISSLFVVRIACDCNAKVPN